MPTIPNAPCLPFQTSRACYHFPHLLPKSRIRFPSPTTIFPIRANPHLLSCNFSPNSRTQTPRPCPVFSSQIPLQESPYRMWIRSFASNDGDLVDAVVPFMGESVTDGILATFLKKPGDRVEVDEPIAQIETDKVTIDVASPEAGIVQKLVAREGDTVTPGTKVAIISKSDSGSTQVPSAKKVDQDEPKPSPPTEKETPKVQASQKEPKTTLPPPPKVTTPLASKATASELVLPPKERERRGAVSALQNQPIINDGFIVGQERNNKEDHLLMDL